VITKSGRIKSLYREAWKHGGSSKLDFVEGPEDFEPHLGAGSPAVLVIDWNLEESSVVALLNRVQGSSRELAILIHTDKISGKAISIGLEYGVDYVGNSTNIPAEIKIGVNKAIESCIKQSPIKNIISKISSFKKRGEPESAMLVLQSTLEKVPHVAIIELELAAVYIDCGRWSDAEPLLQKLAAAQPPNLRAQHLYARLLMKGGNFREAELLLQNCKLLNPYNAPRLVDLGRSIIQQPGRAHEALAVFDQALQMDPQLAAAKLGKTECLLAQGDVDEALELIKGLASPRELASLFNLAAILNIKDGKFMEGIGLYQVALRSIQNDHTAISRLYFNAALGFQRWDKPEDALQCLRKSLELDPTFARSQSLIKKILASDPGSMSSKQASARSHGDAPHFREETTRFGLNGNSPGLHPLPSHEDSRLAYGDRDDADIA